jgi:hypothetical protein
MPAPYEIPGTYASDLLDVGTDMGPFSVGGVLYFPAVTAWNGDTSVQNLTTDPVGLPSAFGMFKSADSGVTWDPVGADVSMVSFDVADFASANVWESRFFCGVLDTPNNRFMALYYGAVADPMQAALSIAWFDFGSESWTLGATTGPERSFLGAGPGSSDSYSHHVVAALDDSGNVAVGYQDYNSAAPCAFVTRYKTDGTWDDPTVFPAPTADIYKWYAACPGSGLRTHAILHRLEDGSEFLYHYLLSDATGLPGEAAELIPSTHQNNTNAMQNPMVNRGGELTLIGETNPPPVYLYTAAEAEEPDWTETEAATPFSVNVPMSAAYDSEANTVLYVTYDDAVTKTVAITWDGTDWGEPVEISPVAESYVRAQIGPGSSMLLARLTFTSPAGWGPFFSGPSGGAVVTSGCEYYGY